MLYYLFAQLLGKARRACFEDKRREAGKLNFHANRDKIRYAVFFGDTARGHNPEFLTTPFCFDLF